MVLALLAGREIRLGVLSMPRSIPHLTAWLRLVTPIVR